MRFLRSFRQVTGVGLVLAYLLGLAVVEAKASWLIDEKLYHVSVHGQMSCRDCHDDIESGADHPDPLRVNAPLSDFFRPEQCGQCHQDILAAAEKGLHGPKPIAGEREIRNCLGCHDPHYQTLTHGPAAKVDPQKPAAKPCALCHEAQNRLPELSLDDQECLSCHRRVGPEDPAAAKSISAFCFNCHGRMPARGEKNGPPLIDVTLYGSTIHADISCLTCHPGAAQFQHGARKPAGCLTCHHRHPEITAHDTHSRVSCQACHLDRVKPVKTSAGLEGQINRSPGETSTVHQMTGTRDQDFCRRCHFSGNSLGAVAMVLPAKSIICLPCHSASLTAGDPISSMALIIFSLGLITAGSIWFTGTLNTSAGKGKSSASGLIAFLRALFSVLFSRQILAVILAFILDGLLQRRLFRIDKVRWLVHGLIFFPFVFRFGWGLVALAGSLWLPRASFVWMALDKNNPLTAFLFDFSGGLVLVGILLMLIRKYVSIPPNRPSGLPGADWPAYALLGGLISSGFILEGLRIALTGQPQGSAYAFIGHGIARLFLGVDLTDIYGYFWYGHAIVTGVFVAYLPFSRMFHIIMAPVSLVLASVDKQHRST